MPENSPSLPDFTRWPSFPFEGDMRVKALAAPVEVEPPRSGEDAAECVACNTPDDAYIWVSDRWRVRAMDRPTGLPVVLILECRSHLDLGDLPNLLAAELGVMTVRLERAIRSLDDVARVHVNRWGDGSAHLHMWFLARPYGRLQLRGTFLSLWDDILPVIPEHQWRENLALVAAWLAEFGGRPVAEPAHIQWQSPSRFSETPTAEAEEPAEADPGAIPTQRRPADLSDIQTTKPTPAYAGEAQTLDLSGSAARAEAIITDEAAASSQASDDGATPADSSISSPPPADSEPPVELAAATQSNLSPGSAEGTTELNESTTDPSALNPESSSADERSPATATPAVPATPGALGASAVAAQSPNAEGPQASATAAEDGQPLAADQLPVAQGAQPSAADQPLVAQGAQPLAADQPPVAQGAQPVATAADQSGVTSGELPSTVAGQSRQSEAAQAPGPDEQTPQAGSFVSQAGEEVAPAKTDRSSEEVHVARSSEAFDENQGATAPAGGGLANPGAAAADHEQSEPTDESGPVNGAKQADGERAPTASAANALNQG